MRLNENRFTTKISRTRYAKLNRRGSKTVFYLRVANIQTPQQAMNPNLKPQKPNISLDTLKTLVEQKLCGFSRSNHIEAIPWLFDLDPLEGFSDEYHAFNKVLTNLESIVSVRPDDWCGMDAASLENNTQGLAYGFRALTDAMLQSGELDSELVTPLAILHAHIEAHRPQEARNNFFEKHDASISSENIPGLLKAVQEKLVADSLPQKIASALTSFRDALQNFQGRSWNTLVEQWNSDASPEEQWELFRQSNVLPEVRPCWFPTPKPRVYGASCASINQRHFRVFIKKDAKYLFNIDGPI